MKNRYFSIVIPAHNEVDTLVDTINHATAQAYPRDAYEIIIVENGSNDGTWELALRLQRENPEIKIYQSGKGVSKARNCGADHINLLSEWVIFLDADTVLGANFLNDFSNFLTQHSHTNYVIGTPAIAPYKDESLKARLWFRFYDFGHWLTQTSYSVQLCRSDVVRKIAYDETLLLAEDLQYIRDAKRFGRFFLLPTKNVFTSTRRFRKIGYTKLFFYWIFFGIMPRFIRRKIQYTVVR